MRRFSSSDIRNFTIVGHDASGKTCLAEAMLINENEISRMGKIEEGSTISYFHPGEKTRQISIHSKPRLLEPIMDIGVKVSEEYMGDISGKSGKMMGMESDGNFQIIKAQVPQAEIYHYSTTIRSLTGKSGKHSESLSYYENMPKDYQQKVIKESQKAEDE